MKRCPAEPFYLEFEWSSLINKSVTATTTLLIEAEQRHEWDITAVHGEQQFVEPRSDYQLEFNITNIGNYVDEVQLIPTLEVVSLENDTSIWSVHETIQSTSLDVNASSTLTVIQSIPYAWKDAEATLTYSVVSGGTFSINSKSNSLFLSMQNGASTLQRATLRLCLVAITSKFNLSNEEIPIDSIHDELRHGWNISLPDGNLMEPGQLTYADIYVEAPSDAREGDVSLLEVRISDAVGKGMEVFQIPVRVVGSSSYELQSSGDWFISSNGGYPLAWIENTGNDMPQIGLQVSDLPEGWIAEVDTPVEFSPGEIKGCRSICPSI